MKIVIDSALKLLTGVFEPYAEVVYKPGADTTPADVQGVDAIITRTRTRCDAKLLEGSRVRIIASATIGFDHIDTAWCRTHNITVATSAGSNARGVAQYVFAAIGALGISPRGKTLGIVGSGNIGSIVATIGRRAGFSVLENDPPREAREGAGRFVTLEKLLKQSDIVTLHVPLEESTRDMAGDDFLRHLKPGAVLINTSRGEVLNEKAVIKARSDGRIAKLVVDVWRDEPDIDRALLAAADIATAHIAGYSLQGRANAGAMAVRAVATELGIEQLRDWYPAGIIPSKPREDMPWEEITERMPLYYDILADDTALRASPKDFESLRNNYRFRPEFF